MISRYMVPSPSNHSLEDPLSYLPRKSVQSFAKRRLIYDPRLSDRFYVLISGRVKIASTSAPDGRSIVRIIGNEAFFGESSLIGCRQGTETAEALDDVTVMSWSASEIEEYIEREPRLGVALSQYLVRESLRLQDRISSMAFYKTPERVMLALLELCETLGTPQEDGATRIGGLTHQTLAEYIGTSRELVSGELNRLRRLAFIRYSRKHLDIYTLAIREVLRGRGVTLPQRHLALALAAV